jgi:hypothetical protein
MDSRSGLKGKCQNKTARGDAGEQAQQIFLGFLCPGKNSHITESLDPVGSQEKEGKFAVE